MKIFISHASANKQYGSVLVELLTGIGVKAEEIVFTSNSAFGIPIGQNIFDWLKAQISQGCFVVYLLSDEYYESIACLNEMGAAWIIENQHAAIFLPNFQISGKHFQSGAIDPREIGFKMNEEDRVNEFCQMLSKHFDITTNFALLAQRVKRFLSDVDVLSTNLMPISTPTLINADIKSDLNILDDTPKVFVETVQDAISLKESFNEAEARDENLPKVYAKFLNDVKNGKVTDIELLLLNFVIETSKTKLGVGWRENAEVQYIRDWEDVQSLNHVLSLNYDTATRKLQLRGLFEVSEVTGGGNPREIELKNELKGSLFDLPYILSLKIKDAVKRNSDDSFTAKPGNDKGLPF